MSAPARPRARRPAPRARVRAGCRGASCSCRRASRRADARAPTRRAVGTWRWARARRAAGARPRDSGLGQEGDRRGRGSRESGAPRRRAAGPRDRGRPRGPRASRREADAGSTPRDRARRPRASSPSARWAGSRAARSCTHRRTLREAPFAGCALRTTRPRHPRRTRCASGHASAARGAPRRWRGRGSAFRQ